jgi:S-layer protein (TIGR01567 family)
MRTPTFITFVMIFLSMTTTASAAGGLELRGPVATVEDGAVYTWGPQEFAGFNYDSDDDLGTERLTFFITGNSLDEPMGVVYETAAQLNAFDYEDWGTYWTISFLGENYFAGYAESWDSYWDSYLYDTSEDDNLLVDEQLSKILIDDDQERTFSSDASLKLAEGYELAIKGIDSYGNIWLELKKDDEIVDSTLISPSIDGATIADKTYTYTKDLGATQDIVVIAVHFKGPVFHGEEAGLQNAAIVNGIWQISDAPIDVEEDTVYDKMTIQTVDADAKAIMMDNEDNKITLNMNKDILLMEKIRIKTADQDVICPEEPLRFYVYKEITEPGTYEIRGTVNNVVDGATVEWDVSSFAGFYYDIDDNLGTEKIVMTITDDALEEPNGVIYQTTAQQNDFDFEEWGKYWTIGFLAEEYFAAYVEDGATAYLAEDSTDDNLMIDEQLSKVLIDDDEDRTFAAGTPLKLAEGYELMVKSIDPDTGRVNLELQKNGEVVDTDVVEPSKSWATISDKTYTYRKNLGETQEIVVIAVHFRNAYRGGGQSLVSVDGVWQISDTCTDVEEDTEYDKMTIQTVNADTLTIMMNNEDNKINLYRNSDSLLMENIRIKTSDQGEISAEVPLRFYIYKEATVEEPETPRPSQEIGLI